MKPYTFYLREALHETPSFQFIRCEDDDDARTQACALLDRVPHLIEVEIFDGRWSRFRVGRPEAEPRRAAS